MALTNLTNLAPDLKLIQQKRLEILFVEFLFMKNSAKVCFPIVISQNKLDDF